MKTQYKRRNKKSIKTKRKRGGKIREEKIYISLGRQHTNPDIRSVITVEKGPTFYEGESRGEYFTNFAAQMAKEFEEDLAVILLGEPKTKIKQKMYKLTYNDNDAPLEKGSEEPIKCKRKRKKSSKKSN